MKDFSRLGFLQAVTYTLKVVVSKKWREIDTLYGSTSAGCSSVAGRIAAAAHAHAYDDRSYNIALDYSPLDDSRRLVL